MPCGFWEAGDGAKYLPSNDICNHHSVQTVKEEGGTALSDHIQALMVDKLVACGERQKEAQANNLMVFDKAMDALEGDDIKKIAELMNAP